MSKAKYEEMLKDIINNGAEYEYRNRETSCWCRREWRYISGGCTRQNCDDLNDDCVDSNWHKFKVTDGYNKNFIYRKKEPRNWVNQFVGSLDSRLKDYSRLEKDTCKAIAAEAIIRFYNEFRDKVSTYEYLQEDGSRVIDPDNLNCVAKEMGVWK